VPAFLEDSEKNLHPAPITKLRLKDAQPGLHWFGGNVQILATPGRAFAEFDEAVGPDSLTQTCNNRLVYRNRCAMVADHTQNPAAEC
jgi:hypothetical protein